MIIYEGLVICHPKEHCSTWDFCTHYIPHVKGDACSCDSCVPCDMKTLLQHRVKIKEANIAARDKEWVAGVEKILFCCDSYPKECYLGNCPHYPCKYYKWKQLKQSMGVQQ